MAAMQIGRVTEAEEAFRKGMALRGDGASNSHALRSIAEMRRGCGRHLEAVQTLDLERIKPSPEAFVEIAFLRGTHGVDCAFTASNHHVSRCSPVQSETDSFVVFCTTPADDPHGGRSPYRDAGWNGHSIRPNQYSDITCLRAGACYHALGYLQSAVRDYEAAWETAVKVTGAGTKLREEAQGCQWLSFYQRELALYTFAHLDQPTTEFCPDRDLHPIMKGALTLHQVPGVSLPFEVIQSLPLCLRSKIRVPEGFRFDMAAIGGCCAEHWCKKAPPSQEMLATYKAQAPIPAVVLAPPPPPPRQQVRSHICR